MDPVSILGLTASIIPCNQLASALAREVGPSKHSKSDSKLILRTVYGLQWACQELEIWLKYNEEDSAGLYAMQHLEQPLMNASIH